MWQTYKTNFYEPGKTMADIRNSIKQGFGKRKSRKWINAEVFLRLMMQIYGDTMPTSEGTDSTTNKERKILPYETKKSLYKEYMWQCEADRTHPTEIAKETLFNKVFTSMKDEIRLLGCKGIQMIIILFGLLLLK